MPDAKRQSEIILLIINSKNLKSLERLIIQHCVVTDEQLEQILKQLPKLRVLKLTNCSNIKTAFQETLFDSEKFHSKALEKCILQDMRGLINFKITSHTLHYLSIKQAPSLQKFYFYSTSLTQLCLSNAPHCNQFDIYAKELQEADFSGNTLLNDLHLQKIILGCQNLKQMNLQCCDEEKIQYRALKESIPVFAERIAQNGEAAEFLKAAAGELINIIRNQSRVSVGYGENVSGWLWKCLCTALAYNTKKNLWIEAAHCKINNEDVIQLSKAIEKNLNVGGINLSRNNIEDKDVIFLTQALEKNQIFKILILGYNNINYKGAIALAQLLEKSQSIEDIDLKNNSLGDKGTIVLAQALKKNKTVKTINLDSNNIGDKGAIALAQMLEKNKVVTTISLSINNIGDEGAAALIDMAQKNNTISYIILKYNKISDYCAFIESLRNLGKRSESHPYRSEAIERAVKVGALFPLLQSVVINAGAKIFSKKLTSDTNYMPNFIQLNPFTFFSEHADREKALCYTQNHQEQLSLHLKKALEVWELSAKDTKEFKKKDHELQLAAQTFGFKCTAISKDGNCLFEAVSVQLKKILPNQKEYYNHEQLRALAVSYLMKHQAFYENFVEDHSFTNFIHKMSMPGTWAENVVLNALAHIFDVKIVVINSDNSPPIILKKPHARGIIYLGYEVNSHYQSLDRDLSLVPKKMLDNFIEYAEVLQIPSETTMKLV